MGAGSWVAGGHDAGGDDEDLRLAQRAVDLAADIALDLFWRGVRTQHKDDGTPVSEADLEVDRQLVDLLSRERPDDSVLSEESGLRAGQASTASTASAASTARRWIIDPIDGTFNFVTGNGTWGTHVALEIGGEIRLGVISRPVSGRRWWAARGVGAFRQERSPGSAAGGWGEPLRLHVSTSAELAGARASLWAPDVEGTAGELRRHGVSLPAADLDDVLRVAEGEMDAVVGSGMAWDQAPAVVLVEEAGGRFRDRRGGRRLDLVTCLYSNGRIDDQLLPLLRPLIGGSRPEP